MKVPFLSFRVLIQLGRLRLVREIERNCKQHRASQHCHSREYHQLHQILTLRDRSLDRQTRQRCNSSDGEVRPKHSAEVVRMTARDLNQARGNQRDEGSGEESKEKGEEDEATERVVVVDGKPDDENGEIGHEGTDGDDAKVTDTVGIEGWKDATEDRCSARGVVSG